MVHPLASSEIRTKGSNKRRSHCLISPSRHHRQSASTSGSITVEGLLVIAATKKKIVSQKKIKFRLRSRDCKKHEIANRYKKADCVFFISVTHATDCTSTGCNAQ